MSRSRCHWDGRECPYDSTPVCLMSRDGKTCDGEPIVRAAAERIDWLRLAVWAMGVALLLGSIVKGVMG